MNYLRGESFDKMKKRFKKSFGLIYNKFMVQLKRLHWMNESLWTCAFEHVFIQNDEIQFISVCWCLQTNLNYWMNEVQHLNKVNDKTFDHSIQKYLLTSSRIVI